MRISEGMPHIDEARKQNLVQFAPYVAVLPWFNSNVLHKLYINVYKPLENFSETYSVRAITCADLLQSPNVKRIRHNVFVMDTILQDELRLQMQTAPETMKRLAMFMLAYTQECRKQFHNPTYLESYKIEGNLILHPSLEAGRISRHIAERLNQVKNFTQKKNTVGYYLSVLEQENINEQQAEIIKFLKGYQEYQPDAKGIPDIWKNFKNADDHPGDTISIKIPRQIREVIINEIIQKTSHDEQIDATEDAPPASFFIEHGMDADEFRSQANRYLSEHPDAFIISTDEMAAQYRLKWMPQEMWICQNDDGQRPVTYVEISDRNAILTTLQYFAHISRWERIRSQNVSGSDAAENIELVIRQMKDNTQFVPVTPQNDVIRYEYDSDWNGALTAQFQMDIINKGKTMVYCTLLYLSNTFEISARLYTVTAGSLPPQQSNLVNSGNTITMEMAQHIQDFNHPECEFFIKLIADYKPFDVYDLEQSPLPTPRKPGRTAYAS